MPARSDTSLSTAGPPQWKLFNLGHWAAPLPPTPGTQEKFTLKNHIRQRGWGGKPTNKNKQQINIYPQNSLIYIYPQISRCLSSSFNFF